MLGAYELECWALCEGEFAEWINNLCRFGDSQGGVFHEHWRLRCGSTFQHGDRHEWHKPHRWVQGHLRRVVDQLYLQGALGVKVSMSASLSSGVALAIVDVKDVWHKTRRVIIFLLCSRFLLGAEWGC